MRLGNLAALALGAMKLMPPSAFHRLRKNALVGDAMLRVFDRLLPADALLTKRIRMGPLEGMVLDIDPRSQDIVVGRYESEVFDIINSSLRPGAIAFDVGAHLGYVSLLMASRAGSAGRVISFEPDPVIIDGLRANLRRNAGKIEATVIPVESAVGSSEGHAAFTRGWRTTRGRLAGETQADFEVATTTLDRAAARFGAPDMVKIDVEGAELEVLQGGTGLLQDTRPFTVLEAHAPSLAEEAVRTFEHLDYTCERIAPTDRKETYVVARP